MLLLPHHKQPVGIVVLLLLLLLRLLLRRRDGLHGPAPGQHKAVLQGLAEQVLVHHGGAGAKSEKEKYLSTFSWQQLLLSHPRCISTAFEPAAAVAVVTAAASSHLYESYLQDFGLLALLYP